MLHFAICGSGCMFDALYISGSKYGGEFALKQLLFLAGQHFEDIFSQHGAAWYAKLAQLAVPVPGNNLVVAIDCVERKWQAIDNCLDEASLGLHFRRSSLDLNCQIGG